MKAPVWFGIIFSALAWLDSLTNQRIDGNQISDISPWFSLLLPKVVRKRP